MSSPATLVAGSRLSQWLDVLRAVLPPAGGALVIGAGPGHGPVLQWLARAGVASTLLEAEPATFELLTRNTPASLDWVLRGELVLASPDSVDFHIASHANESSLIPAEALQGVWPNLRSAQRLRPAQCATLGRLLEESEPDWLLVDCLPAAALLQGADLSGVSVLMARVVLTDQWGVDASAGLDALQSATEPQGLRLVATVEERHPAIGLAIFVRDIQALRAMLDRITDDAARESTARQLEAQGKAAALARCTQLESDSARLQASVDAEAAAKSEALARSTQLAEQCSKLQAALDAESEARRGAQARIEQLADAAAIVEAALAAEHEAHAHASARGDAWAAEAARLHAACAPEAQAVADARALNERLAEARTAQQRLIEDPAQASANANALAAELARLQMASAADTQAIAELRTAKERLVEEVADLRAALDVELKAKAHALATVDRLTAESVAKAEGFARELTQLARLKEQSAGDTEKLGKTLGATVQREVANAVTQLEAFARLQEFMATGRLIPSLHDWAISADFAVLLVQLLEQNRFDAVVEFGSGSSTLLIADTLTKQATAHPDRPRPFQVAFEHLAKYHASTTSLLERAGLRDQVLLALAPLAPMQAESGDSFNYYTADSSWQALSNRLAGIDAPRILAVIDGPPENSGHLARYPALELLLRAVPRQQGWLLLDDHRRPGEQEIARRWQALLTARGAPIEVTDYALEKGACLIRFDSSDACANAVRAV